MEIISIWLSFSSIWSEVMSISCGIDNSAVSHVYEGFAKIETYPWLGILYYPQNKKRYTSAVVLITRQIALGSALEIDKLPKVDFRARARVVVGQNCSVSTGVGVRDYSYHPDYSKNTYSAIALIQLETDHLRIELRPICRPPQVATFQNLTVYAMILTDDCRRSTVKMHKMTFVDSDECKNFYRRTGLDIDTMWPTYIACAKSVSGGHCVWRSGAILVIKAGTRWRLVCLIVMDGFQLGFGVYGPGCQAPARFLDYGMYHKWVLRSVERIGRPAITNLGQNHVVLRRSLSNIQRFGPCDKEEMGKPIYTEQLYVGVQQERSRLNRAIYNLTIVDGYEYSCVVVRADYLNLLARNTPKLRLTRWCLGPNATIICVGFQYTEIQFSVEITFSEKLSYSVVAYGKKPEVIGANLAHRFRNRFVKYIRPPSYEETVALYKSQIYDNSYPLYGKKKGSKNKYDPNVYYGPKDYD